MIDLLDLVRSIAAAAERAAENRNYPVPCGPVSPLLASVRQACVERGYTATGLALPGVLAAPVQPVAAPDDLRNTLELAYIALDTPHSLHVVRLKAMKGIRKMLDAPCTAAADRGALQANGQHPAPCARDCEAPAFKNQLRERDALIARLKARLARRHAPPSPETQQAIAAARATGQSVATTSGGLVFMNDGAEPGSRELDCPACGGSGHAGDVAAGSAP